MLSRHVALHQERPRSTTAHIESLGQGLILFDGRPSAGKTTLAKAMAARIRCGVVDGDDFIVRDQRRFVCALKTDALRERIEASLAATPLVMLSTVCAREVATKVDAARLLGLDRKDLAHAAGYRRARLCR